MEAATCCRRRQASRARINSIQAIKKPAAWRVTGIMGSAEWPLRLCSMNISVGRQAKSSEPARALRARFRELLCFSVE